MSIKFLVFFWGGGGILGLGGGGEMPIFYFCGRGDFSPISLVFGFSLVSSNLGNSLVFRVLSPDS